MGYALSEFTITFVSDFKPEELAVPVGNYHLKIFVILTVVKILFSLEFKMAKEWTFNGIIKYNKMLITEQFN